MVLVSSWASAIGTLSGCANTKPVAATNVATKTTNTRWLHLALAALAPNFGPLTGGPLRQKSLIHPERVAAGPKGTMDMASCVPAALQQWSAF